MKVLKQEIVSILNTMTCQEIATTDITLKAIGLDSFDRINLLLELENKYGIKFDDITFDKISTKSITIDNVIDMVNKEFQYNQIGDSPVCV